ncbi:hypothetical protein XENOCAPTIV_016576 [Xenoophorus captivus]|uniref:Uncharacterized protein n=1 Tax=Xenoophorus captivus TaxID=1517983 RepID=A0ABV0QTC8_9TELE
MQSNRTTGWTTSQSMSETQTPSNLTTGKSPWQHRPSLQQIVLRCLAVMTGPLSCRDEDMDGEWEAPQIPNPACESAPGWHLETEKDPQPQLLRGPAAFQDDAVQRPGT